MEPVLFYGVPIGCSFGSIVVLEWLNEPYRLCRIVMPVDPKDETYVRVNPVRETPGLLLQNNEVLNESFAILHHLVARDRSNKLGFRQGTREFDRLNYVLSFLTASFHPAWAFLFNVHKFMDDAATQEVVRAKARAKIAGGYTRIEAMLAGREWLVGDAPTIADAYLSGIARWGEALGLFDIKRDYPRLYKLLQKLEADKAVIFAHAIEDEKPATTSGQFKGHTSLEELRPRLAA